jgi:hypothetical protein
VRYNATLLPFDNQSIQCDFCPYFQLCLVVNHGIATLERYLKRWFQPARSSLLLGTLAGSGDNLTDGGQVVVVNEQT